MIIDLSTGGLAKFKCRLFKRLMSTSRIFTQHNLLIKIFELQDDSNHVTRIKQIHR